jgi:hypothetical protein
MSVEWYEKQLPPPVPLVSVCLTSLVFWSVCDGVVIMWGVGSVGYLTKLPVSRYIASEDGILDEWQIISDLNEAVVAWWNLYPAICPGWLRKAVKNISEDSLCPDWDLNRPPSEYQSRALLRVIRLNVVWTCSILHYMKWLNCSNPLRTVSVILNIVWYHLRFYAVERLMLRVNRIQCVCLTLTTLCR